MLKKSVLLFASACVTIFIMANLAAAPQAFAQQQQADQRDAAMVKCIAQAHKQFASDSEDMQRADFYKACMVRAGFKP